VDIRCQNFQKFGEVAPGATGEYRVLCRNSRCKIGNEVVVHIFNLEKISEDGIIRPTETKRFKRP
jgi:hypothetical protein